MTVPSNGITAGVIRGPLPPATAHSATAPATGRTTRPASPPEFGGHVLPACLLRRTKATMPK